MKQTNKVYIYGKHALMEALAHAPHALKRVYLAPHIADIETQKLIRKLGIEILPLEVGKAKADMLRGTSHQGVIGLILLQDLVKDEKKFLEEMMVTQNTLLILLDGLTDPHNVGTIVRSAAGFGVTGVLLPEKNQSPVTATVIKSSAGMAFRIPLIPIASPVHIVKELKKKGFRVYGLAGRGSHSIASEQFATPSLFIFGNEAGGISGEMRTLCDEIISIPTHPRCESLNVATSAAVALYAWSIQRPDSILKKK